MPNPSTPPTTVKDLRACIKARGLDWLVRFRTGYRAFYAVEVVLLIDGGEVTFAGSRRQCLDLAWRIVEAEPKP